MSEIGKLITLKISDLKSIDVLEFSLNTGGEFITLEGDNGVGKSTVMEAVETLFNGGRIPDGIIRNGKKEAFVEGIFSSGYKARRRIRRDKNKKQVATLDVYRPDGGKVAAPQQILKEIFAGYMSPSRLANMSGADLYKEVVKQLPIDVEALESEVNLSAALLSDVNAEGRVLGKMEEPVDPRPDIPAFDQAAYDLLDEELTKSREIHNRGVAQTEELYTLQEQITKLNDRVIVLQTHLKNNQEGRSPGVVEIELAGMKEARDKRAHAEAVLKIWERYDEWNQKAETFQAKAQAADKEYREATEDLRKELSSAVGPGGVTVDESRDVFISGSPWRNAAFSERLKAAAILQINALPDGKLPFMFIEHGESMNSEKRMEIAKVAIEAGAVVFIEILEEDINELKITSQQIVDATWSEVEAVKKIMKKSTLPEEAVPTDQKDNPATKTIETRKALPGRTVQVPPLPGMTPLGLKEKPSVLPSEYPDQDSELDIF